MFNYLVHNILKAPYRLHIRRKRLKNPLAPTYILLHGLADTADLWKPLIDKLPKDANYIALDLLGHGKSKTPEGSNFYSATEQARNVYFSTLSVGLTSPYILVGHSFGSLVAIEFAKRHKKLVGQLVLCSPPIYRDPVDGKLARLRPESILRVIYKQLIKQPKGVISAYSLASKISPISGYSKTKLDQNNFTSFAETLRSGIINQSAGRSLSEIDAPTTIIYGALDPVIIPSNLAKLKTANSNIILKMLPTSHAITKTTVSAILKTIEVNKK